MLSPQDRKDRGIAHIREYGRTVTDSLDSLDPDTLELTTAGGERVFVLDDAVAVLEFLHGERLDDHDKAILGLFLGFAVSSAQTTGQPAARVFSEFPHPVGAANG